MTANVLDESGLVLKKIVFLFGNTWVQHWKIDEGLRITIWEELFL